MARHRNQNLGYQSGHITYGSTDLGLVEAYSDYKISDDYTGYPDDHPLRLEHRAYTGDMTDWHGVAHLEQCPIGYGIEPEYYSPEIETYLDEIDIRRILSQTGPLTPKVFTITDVLEFRDIPRLLKHAGDLLWKLGHAVRLNPLREAAAATLAYQFGWQPLVQDISRMLDFGEAVAKTRRNLLKANSRGGLQRKIHLGGTSGSRYDPHRTICSIWGCYVSPPWTSSMKTEGWATAHWYLNDPSQLGYEPTWWQAFRQTYGFAPGLIPIEIWKALPWSWAVDWFANISNLMLADYNCLYYTPSRVNRMWKTTISEHFHPWTDGSGNTFNGVRSETVIKNRDQPSISGLNTPKLSIPRLDGFKLSILGSMTVLRLLHGGHQPLWVTNPLRGL